MVHDERHLNRYMCDVHGEGFSTEYAYPEGWNLPFRPQIIIRDNVKAFPECNDFTKGRNTSITGWFLKYVACLNMLLDGISNTNV